MLDMVRLRLRQWGGVATGPGDWAEAFARPLPQLWLDAGAPEPTWAPARGSRSRRRGVARDLVASALRFNHRWRGFVEALNLDPINLRIDHYNRYYVLEKECVLGSHRLAARGFEPRAELSLASILARHPLLEVPHLPD
jgi:hypothetical protein